VLDEKDCTLFFNMEHIGTNKVKLTLCCTVFLEQILHFEHLELLLVDKDKAIPLQAWTDPKDSRRLRLPDFKTFGTGGW